jgi:predicted O-methyltransferase YrrM
MITAQEDISPRGAPAISFKHVMEDRDDITAVAANVRTADLRRSIERIVAEPPAEEVRALIGRPVEWLVSLETAHLVSRLVRHLQPRSILEFGAGASSLVLASALHANGSGRLTSIEHQPTFAQTAWEKMTQFPGIDTRLVEARLGLRFSRHGLLHAYLGIDDALRERGPFDFMFIDAPPGHLGRDATLLAAAPYAARGAIIVLDDARRPWEQTAIRRWLRALKLELVFESHVVGRGVVVLELLQPTAAAFSLRTFAGTIHDRFVHWRSGDAR